MTKTLNPPNRVQRSLYLLCIIFSAANVGTVTAGTIAGIFDPAYLETYRATGASIGAIAGILMIRLDVL